MKTRFITKLLLLAFFLLSAQMMNAQEEEAYQRMVKFNKENYKDFLFFSIGQTHLLDAWNSPLLGFDQKTIDNFVFNIPEIRSHTSLVKISFDTRLDLFQYDKLASLSIALPFGLSINQIGLKDIYKENWLSLHIPLYLQGNFFRNSCKDRIDNWGFKYGIGVQAFVFPFRDKSVDYTSNRYVANQIMPVMRFGVNRYNAKKKNNQGLDLIFGLNSTTYTYDANFEDQYSVRANTHFSLQYIHMF
jgi:hypothetical protein